MSDERTAAPALKPLTDSELVRTVNRGFVTDRITDDTPEARARNIKRARDELSHIETLRQNSSFQWYSSLIEQGFKDSRAALESPDTPPKALPIIQAKFQVWREIARLLDEREIEHRRLENTNDPQIEVIRERLDLH